MLPPSDSFLHQELKLAEVLSNIPAIEVPPPSYTLMPVTTHESFHAYTTDDDDDGDEEDCITPLAPVTVHVDASIRIDGQANTIILLPPVTTHAATAGPASSRADQDRTTQAGHVRAEKLTSTALAALRDAGVCDMLGGNHGSLKGDSGRVQRPLELHVNASLSVSGEKNVVYAGVPRKVRKGGSGSGSWLAGEERGQLLESSEVIAEAGRERRSQSEPLEKQRPKRCCL